ncbi:hypothetical protein CONPUDRAFT_169506 [Coniophora puteana RWD-64-598 SS2]|uniref:F-box domain-containing protein n=1 Tax=Coniophora puteana (strain RWD-64-598) TaxID=741705 RepID=A0A5M3M823_CONPW|nr:uncharacterized protein CONPUDRAFT_169506 [Coniophora puteana RWD-64-598 SS2]EIW75076.1 hypothetical protein CONPUDRAFT_169506 [Coniophora puteana RWD-64-598 SS2]
MHHVFLISELIELIFQQIECQETLFRLSRVCHVFKDPALDALYGSIQSLPRLLTCLSSDLLDATPGGDGGASFKNFCRELTHDDWASLASYARRVKNLDIKVSIHRRLHKDTFDALCKCPIPLFPRLRTLRLSGTIYLASLHRIVLTPSLRVLHIPDVTADDFISNAPTPYLYCPNIESFTCLDKGTGRDPAKLMRLAKTLCRWKYLHHLDCGPLNVEILAHLAHASSLGTLVIPVMSSDTWLSERYRLRDVDELNLVIDSIDTWARALRALFQDNEGSESHSDKSTYASLRALTMTMTPIQGVLSVQAPAQRVPSPPSLISSTLSSLVCRKHLSVLKLSDYWSSPLPKGRFGIEELTPLRGFAQLRELVIKFRSYPLTFDDMELAALVSYWPRLERLHLTKLEQPVSLTGLIAVLQACPSLCYLDLAVRLDPADVANVSASSPLPRNAYITWMDLEHTHERAKDADPLARLLHCMLPSLLSCDRSVSSRGRDACSPAEARRWMLSWRRRTTEPREWRARFWLLVFAEMHRLKELEEVKESEKWVNPLAKSVAAALSLYRRE